MNILTRMNEMSVDDLQQLQIAIQGEVQRRKAVSRLAAARGLTISGSESSKGGHPAATSTPVPPATPPRPRHRAA